MAKRGAKPKSDQSWIDDGPFPYEPSKKQIKEEERYERERRRMFNQYVRDNLSTGKMKAKYAEGVKNPGRAQPKGTIPRAPRRGPGSGRYMSTPRPLLPRTGPGSGGGGLGSRWSRLTGGFRFGSK